MKPNALEDLIYETESRSANISRNGEDTDVYTQLQQKEQDLILAAELGKALLAKNEDLQRQIKDLNDETSKKIEALEQERHVCRRKLENTQEECETKVAELQTDITELKKQLDFRETCLKQIEREKTQIIQDLQAQNQRLKTQLKESGKAEESLSYQLNSLRDQCNLKKTSLQDHESHMEILRDEVQMLTERKAELERRLSVVTADRDAISATVEECQDRVRMLERHAREQDLQLRSSSRELERLQAANAQMGDKLEALQSISTPKNRSLLNEMECDEDYHTSSFSSLEKEVVSCHDALRNLCGSLRQRSATESESSDQSMASDLNLSQYKVGMLTAAVEELEGLLNLPGRVSGLDIDLEIDLHRCKEALDRMEKDLAEKNEELKCRAELIQSLKGKLEIKETELRQAQEAVETAKADLRANGDFDDIVQEAREARDSAVARKSELELQLARARIDVLQANSQLMEAVQQKVELSEQLEQWQMDMQCLLDEQMKEKLTHSEKKRLAASAQATPVPPTTGPRRIFSYFR